MSCSNKASGVWPQLPRLDTLEDSEPGSSVLHRVSDPSVEAETNCLPLGLNPRDVTPPAFPCRRKARVRLSESQIRILSSRALPQASREPAGLKASAFVAPLPRSRPRSRRVATSQMSTSDPTQPAI